LPRSLSTVYTHRIGGGSRLRKTPAQRVTEPAQGCTERTIGSRRLQPEPDLLGTIRLDITPLVHGSGQLGLCALLGYNTVAMKFPWRRLIQGALLLLSLGFLASLVVGQWNALQAYEWHLDPAWALLALVGLGLRWLMQLGLWRYVLARLGGSLRYWQAARVWFLSNVSRYIPGSIWQYYSMVEMAAEHGVSRVTTLASTVLHQVISIAAGVTMSALYFGWAGEGVWFARLRPFLYAVPAGLLLLQPRLLERSLNWLLGRFRRPPIQVTLTWGQICGVLAFHMFTWVVIGLSFAALVRALTPVTWALVPRLVAIFAASYVIGFLSILTPSGLGVRESIMTLLLAAVLPSGVAAVVAVVSRLWMVVAELIGAGVSLLVGGRHRVPGARPQTLVQQSPASSPEPRTPSQRHRASSTRSLIPTLLVLLLIVAYVVGFSALSIRLHEAQLTHKADLGQMDLAIWNTSRGRFLQAVKNDFVSTRLTDHVEPIFAPVSLIFWLWDDVRALLVLQSFALAIGALPVFWLARSSVHSARSTKSRLPEANQGSELAQPNLAGWIGLLAAFVYLMVPALQAANLTEFHAIPLAVPFVLFAFWFAERGHWVRFSIACLLLLAVKEEAALLALMMGLYVALRPLAPRLLRRRRVSEVAASDAPDQIAPPASPIAPTIPQRASHAPLVFGAATVVLSAVWFVVATFIIIPRHAGPVYGDAASVYFQRYGALGDGITGILRSLLTRPGLVWRTVTEPMRLHYLAGLLASVGFLPLLAPEILLLGAPLLAANLLSSYAAQYSGGFHYSAPLVPYLVIAAIIGTRRLAREEANCQPASPDTPLVMSDDLAASLEHRLASRPGLHSHRQQVPLA